MEPKFLAASVRTGGGVDDLPTSLSTPQFQKVMRVSWGAVAFESPAIILNPAGKVLTRAWVLRR